MDREPPVGARRRWTASELVSEQPAETVCQRAGIIRSGRNPAVIRERQMSSAG